MTCRFLPTPSVYKADNPRENDVVQCVVMINLGPNARDRKILSEEERKEPATGFHELNQTWCHTRKPSPAT